MISAVGQCRKIHRYYTAKSKAVKEECPERFTIACKNLQSKILIQVCIHPDAELSCTWIRIDKYSIWIRKQTVTLSTLIYLDDGCLRP